MEYIKRKISREDIISRDQFTYEKVTEGFIYMNFPLYQKFNDIGFFTDIEYVNEDVDYSPLIEKLKSSGLTFDFYTATTPTFTFTGFSKHIRESGASVEDYYKSGQFLTGSTEERLNEVKSYDVQNPYIVGLDLNEEPYIDLSGNTGTSIDRVLARTTGSTGNTEYTISAFSGSPYIGTTKQTRGIQYTTPNDNGPTTFGFKAQGWNKTNTTLSALTKHEYLMGISEAPKVRSDLFIDRGVVSPIESHERLSEIKTLEEMETYNDGFFDLIKI